jgi:hypothetical protein
MRSPVIGICGLAALVAIVACSSDSATSGGCSPEALRPAIIVQVVAASGPPPNDSTKGAVRDGDYIDSLRPVQFGIGGIQSLGAAQNRPGTYNVTVEHTGFEPWEKDNVVVPATACGIKQPVNLVAELQPIQ